MPYKDKYKRYLRGLCSSCPKPIAQGFRRCHECLDVANKGYLERSKRNRKEREKAGCCRYCNNKLHPVWDKGRIGCVICLNRRTQTDRINRR